MPSYLLQETGDHIAKEDASGDLLLETSFPLGTDPGTGLVQAYVGTFTTPIGTLNGGTLGDTTVTGIVDRAGVPFAPKAVIFWGSYAGTVDGALNQEEWDIFGIDDGITHVCQAIESRWFVGFPWRANGSSADHSLFQLSAIFSAGVRASGYVNGFDVGSFTYHMDLNLDGGFTFGFLAIGGSDLLAKVVLSSQGGYVGPILTVRGVGFQPTGGIFVNHVVGPGNSGGNAWNDDVGSLNTIGWADSALNRLAMCATLLSGNDTYPGVGLRSLHRDWIWIEHNSHGEVGGVTAVPLNFGTLVSWDADGFTYQGPVGGFGVLLFGGVQTLAGTFDQNASDGPMSLDIPQMQPVCILLGSVGATAGAGSTLAHDESWSIGAFDGNHSWSHWHGALYGSTQSANGGAHDGEPVALVLKRNNGFHSANAIPQGTLTGTAMAPGSFTGAWTNTDGTLRSVMYFVFGPKLLVAPVTPPACAPGNFGVADLVLETEG